jgi:Zn-dependent protease with chaperone function
MRSLSLAFLSALSMVAVPAAAESIGEVLHRSHQMRIQALVDVDRDSRAAVLLHESFDKLLKLRKIDMPVELRVVSGGTVAETLQGYVIVVNESLADRPEGERLFVLAHELGHVVQYHWLRMGRLYEKWVPGVVAQAHTDAVAGRLGREAVVVAHQNEFQADAYAFGVLRELGYPAGAIATFLIGMGIQYDTATHPGSRKRMAQLRHLSENGGAEPHHED